MKRPFLKNTLLAALIAVNITVLAACGSTTVTTTGMTAATASVTTATETTTADTTATTTDAATTTSTEASGAPAAPPDGGQGGTAGSTTVDHGSYATLVSEDSTGATYESTGDSENAVRVEGSEVTLTDVTINKTTGATGSGDSSNFYGINAGLLAMDGATVTINHATVNTTTEGSNGIYSYGEGTTVTVSNATIRTTADSAGGVMVTGGGTMVVNESDIETQGAHSAALRTDRGGGTLVVDGGTYVTNGSGSPAIYSTADITTSNATLTANGSEALVIEGKNSIKLTDCTVTGNMTSTNSGNIHNVMIYQSMSGDADTGTSSFSMEGGSLTSKAGEMIYVTNTSCEISLTNVALTLSNDVLLDVAGNDGSNNWGTAGSNGGQCVFTANDQDLTGAILVDEISSLELSMTNGSTFSGSINNENQGGTVNVTIDAASTWTLTGDSYVTAISGNTESINTNGFTLYVNGVASK